MMDVLDIAEVARRTGLTSRTLRFYETRGLLEPLRTATGRRCYGSRELERLNQILALKRAGLSLAQIQCLVDNRPLDLARLIEAQLEVIRSRAAELAEAKALLFSVKVRIDRGEPLDLATFCSLIRSGDTAKEADSWKRIAERYFTAEEQAEWEEKMAALPTDFDSGAYQRQWAELSSRIEAALPMDAGSAQAQAFVGEWFALLKPFADVATPGMWNGTVRLYDNMESWEGEADAGFSKTVWDFIKLATAAHLAGGGTVAELKGGTCR